ncbi:MAG TPA: hypothetical protein VFQ53_33265 [Kofleriaceae bacterium]|nr:hypothetical protein [Kofleriaceae bacterium]
MIHWASWVIWGFGATAVLSVIMAAGHGLGFTRMSIPYLLGTMLTPDRDRARLLGIPIHIVNGWLFSLLYVYAFHAWGGPTWWKGALIGAVHGSFVLALVLPALPALHPRMASESTGPTVVRQLEPPGFLARNYGNETPLWTFFAHLVFGAILGGFYTGP